MIAGGEGQEADCRRQAADGRRQEQEADGRRQEADGRRQEADGRRQEADGRRQEADGRRQEAGLCVLCFVLLCVLCFFLLPLASCSLPTADCFFVLASLRFYNQFCTNLNAGLVLVAGVEAFTLFCG